MTLPIGRSELTGPHWGTEGNGQAVLLPAYHFAPRGSVPIDLTKATAAAVAGGSSATLITIEVPAFAEARLIQIGFASVDPTAVQFSTWALRSQNQGVYDYFDIPTAIGTLDVPATIDVHISGPKTITLLVTNNFNSPSAWNYAARLRGWLYSVAAA